MTAAKGIWRRDKEPAGRSHGGPRLPDHRIAETRFGHADGPSRIVCYCGFQGISATCRGLETVWKDHRASVGARYVALSDNMGGEGRGPALSIIEANRR